MNMNEQHELDILLVEDNPNDAELTQRALRKTDIGARLLIARDGAEAIERVLTDGLRPRVIFLDLKLPKIDGMFAHARKLSDWFGERVAMRSFRRHVSWYTKGFRITSAVRDGMMRIETLQDLHSLFSDVDRSQPFPPSAMRVVRGKATGIQKVSLPAGFLDNLDDDTPLAGADEDAGDGG